MKAGSIIFEFDRGAGKYHPSWHFEKIKAMGGDWTQIGPFHQELADAYERDLSEAIRQEGLGDPEEVKAWAKRMARDCEQNGHPMVTGQALERVFILRLAMGLEEAAPMREFRREDKGL